MIDLIIDKGIQVDYQVFSLILNYVYIVSHVTGIKLMTHTIINYHHHYSL